MQYSNFPILLSLVLALFSVVAVVTTAAPTLSESNPANVNGLTLDRTVLRGKVPSRLIKVWTLASDPENDRLVYNFIVSGGKIMNAKLYPGKEHQTFAISGELLEESGYEAVWDLSEVEPGDYTITAGVDDGCGLCGQTQTQTIRVDPGTDEGISLCPRDFKVVGIPAYRFKQNTVRFLMVPETGQLYETLPPPRWTFLSNPIVGGTSSPIVDIVLNRKQRWVPGSFVRDPNYTSAGCDFSGDFRLEMPGVRKR